MPWKATGKSVIGTLHQKYNLPCQDYNNYRIFNENEIIVGAVADGAGSAQYAEHGAKIAVETVISEITQIVEKLPSGAKLLLDLLESDQNKIDLFCCTLVQEVQEILAKKAQQLNCSLEELACTLIAFIASPQWIVALQIGDGFLVTRADGETDYRLVFEPDKGEFANQTTFVTSNLAQQTIQIKVLNQKTVFICAATDGLERVAIRFKGWQPFKGFFQPLESFMDDYIPEIATEVREKTQGISDVNTRRVESQIDLTNENNTKNSTSIEQQIQPLKQYIPDDKEENFGELELKDITNQDNQKPLEIKKLENTQQQHEKPSYLEKFLSSNRLNDRTNDDKTLLLCLHQQP
ncbi:MAG: protein phosphatase 2C domain-containing protein [Rivularia sp. (in: cyanobacteria)]|jgi:serine/threonine protein phosphatase PrpC